MHRYPWIDLRALGAQAGAVAADAARAGVRRFVVADADRDTCAAGAATQLAVSPAGVAILADDAQAPLAGVCARIAGADDFDAARTALARHALVVLDYALATTVPLERLLAGAHEDACRIVVSLADPHGAAYLARKYAQSPVDIAFAPRDAAALRGVLAACGELRPREPLKLKTFEVQRVEPLGVGLHAVIDGCSQLDGDECVLAGASATSMLLVAAGAARTPGRPLAFGIDAGSAESFVFCGGDRARQLSLLRSGERILTVGAAGDTRAIVVGRVRIESAPLVALHARSASGASARIVMRGDGAVRLRTDGGARVGLADVSPGIRLAGYEPGVGWVDCRMRAAASRSAVSVSR
ncbi:TPA: 3-dehydroquinate synthase II family protein [Burkholderia stabilis]|nr:3-dehydroquinate synthase II family protein [Burkholderia stabilis]HDR9653304.1 3-dehydroquinate synthase II family protein [Burkholderia stabilis]HDR9683727.1 3-dehydroquinate synthase II family protein [Burkholderia stabilis]